MRIKITISDLLKKFSNFILIFFGLTHNFLQFLSPSNYFPFRLKPATFNAVFRFRKQLQCAYLFVQMTNRNVRIRHAEADAAKASGYLYIRFPQSSVSLNLVLETICCTSHLSFAAYSNSIAQRSRMKWPYLSRNSIPFCVCRDRFSNWSWKHRENDRKEKKQHLFTYDI